MSEFHELGGDDLTPEIDQSGAPDLADVGDVPLLPDPFAEPTLSSETQGILDSVTDTMAQANADYAAVAGAEGLPTDLPAPGAESAAAFIDATMTADPEQLRRMAGFEQGVAYEQEVRNDIAEKEMEVQQAEETSAATAEAEMRAWEAERAEARAAAEVEASRRERGA